MKNTRTFVFISVAVVIAALFLLSKFPSKTKADSDSPDQQNIPSLPVSRNAQEIPPSSVEPALIANSQTRTESGQKSGANSAELSTDKLLESEQFLEAQIQLSRSLNYENTLRKEILEQFCQAILTRVPNSMDVANRPTALRSAEWLQNRLATKCVGLKFRTESISAAQLSALSAMRANEQSLFAQIERFAYSSPAPEILDVRINAFIKEARTHTEVKQIIGISNRARWNLGSDLFSVLEITKRNWLREAQKVALSRLACDLTTLCGAEKLESLLTCSPYQLCRPGITVAEVHRLTQPAAVIEASEIIYQRLVEIRAGRR